MSFLTAEISMKLSKFFNELMLTQMQDFARAIHTFHYALMSQELDGDMVEFGCFQGHTARILSCMLQNKKMYVYDSFLGSPPNDENMVAGLCETSVESFKCTFENENLPLPIVHQGFFADLGPEHMPEKICFAHIDANLYISTIDPLKLIYDRVVPGGVIMIDDCPSKYCPGTQRACKEFFADKIEEPFVLKGIPGYADAPLKTVIIKK